MADSKPETSTGMRCHHCAGPLSKKMETSEWTVAPLIRDSFSMIGSAVGGTASAFYGFNHGSACDCILFSLCRFGRGCRSSVGPTCFVILSCSGLIILVASNFSR